MRLARIAIPIAVFSVLICGRIVFAASTDTDEDRLSDDDETHIYHTDPNKVDTDGDGFNDGDEVKTGYSPLVGQKKLLRQVDTDHDGLWDDWEITLGTDLTIPDTDGD